MESRTPMAVMLNDGELILGTIEWYDKNCIKIHRNGDPNLLLFKHNIKYLYKQEKSAEASPEGATPGGRSGRQKSTKTSGKEIKDDERDDEVEEDVEDEE